MPASIRQNVPSSSIITKSRPLREAWRSVYFSKYKSQASIRTLLAPETILGDLSSNVGGNWSSNRKNLWCKREWPSITQKMGPIGNRTLIIKTVQHDSMKMTCCANLNPISPFIMTCYRSPCLLSIAPVHYLYLACWVEVSDHSPCLLSIAPVHYLYIAHWVEVSDRSPCLLSIAPLHYLYLAHWVEVSDRSPCLLSIAPVHYLYLAHWVEVSDLSIAPAHYLYLARWVEVSDNRLLWMDFKIKIMRSSITQCTLWVYNAHLYAQSIDRHTFCPKHVEAENGANKCNYRIMNGGVVFMNWIWTNSQSLYSRGNIWTLFWTKFCWICPVPRAFIRSRRLGNSTPHRRLLKKNCFCLLYQWIVLTLSIKW
jgi:hypothetical protein